MTSDGPTIDSVGLGLVFTWEDRGLVIAVQNFKENARGSRAEVSVKLGLPGHRKVLTHGGLDLNSLTQRAAWAKTLTGQCGELEWTPILQTICLRALRHFREGEPFLEIGEGACEPIPFRINPLVYEGYASILYGSGGVCKSTLAGLAVLLQEQGAQHGPLAASGAQRTLYLDWEADERVFRWTVSRLRAGVGLTGQPFYRRCLRPLVDELDLIDRFIREEDIGFLVLDSLAPACGMELNSPDTAKQFNTALRVLHRPALVLAHIAKGQSETEEPSIFGSAFFGYLARSTWEMKGEKDGAVLHAGLFHRKCNLGPLHKPLGLRFTFSDTTIAICEEFPEESSVLQTFGKKIDRLKSALKQAKKATQPHLCKLTGFSDSYVSGALCKGVGHWCREAGTEGHTTVYEYLISAPVS